MSDNRQQKAMIKELTASDIARMEADGEWCYDSTHKRMVNIRTGEVQEVIDWLIRKKLV